MEATEIQVHQLDGYIVRFHFNAYLIHHRVLGLGDELLNHSNAFTLLPKSNCCDVSISLTLIHQFTLAWIKLGRLEMAKKAVCFMHNCLMVSLCKFGIAGTYSGVSSTSL
ncbi:auxin transporter-like protein 5 [Cucumis melo]|uniref:Auxin transporter-like protein 5 n=1 Tax=Cucumis melo TaxID=3656 RepID=A0A1S3C2R3_CUCME|nr:auxin transporter-like protein 5 [Cucumis melo]